MNAIKPDIILASSSKYRHAQLQTLGLAFRAVAPNLDEIASPHETPFATAKRLALAKAQAVARIHPQSIVIGADQVLDLDGRSMGKPLTHEVATLQLKELSGRVCYFHSAICVISANAQQVSVSTCKARFRELSSAQIESYLQYEKPYDTAGSAKAEGLGIALLEELSSQDPSAIIGLPLIELTKLLGQIGIDPLKHI